MSTAKRFIQSAKIPNTYRQIETVRVEANQGNSWDVRVEGREHPYSGIGGTWLDADNAVGEDASVSFVQGSPLLPIFFSRGSKPNSAFVASAFTATIANFFANWWRYGVKMAYRHFANVWDDPAEADSSISLTVSSGLAGGTGTIVRTDADGIVYWADDNDLKTVDLTDSSTTTTDLASEITSLCLGEITGRSYCTVATYSPGGEEDECELGYAAGAAVAEASSAISQGAYDCDNELAYDAENYAQTLLDANPPSEEESEEWQGCYETGLLARYVELYNEGWTGGGCSLP